MLKQRRAIENRRTCNQATLYRFVFDSYITKLWTFTLLAFLLLQPFTQAYAALDTDAPSNTDPSGQTEIPVVEIPMFETTPIDIQDTQTQSLSPTETQNIQQTQNSEEPVVLPQTAQDNLAEATTSGNNIQHGADSHSSDNFTTTNNSSTSVDTSEASSTEVFGTTTKTLPTDSPVLDTTTDLEIPTTTIKTATATQAVPIQSTTSAPVQTTDYHNASEFQFDTSQCAVVGNGAYYCNEKKATSSLLSDGVFSAPDGDGDLEIFIRLGGKESQLTHNTYDDASPQYDVFSDRIVWHSYINDRYQIISYDLKTEEMVRFTDSSYNNMEPVAYGTTTVWQAWIDNDWEIMLYDGITLRQLTNNNLEDVSPHIRDGYIVWQTQFQDGWQVAVYDQKTKRIEYIPSEGGKKVENPRFVLVYDSMDKNGDTQTLGYDFDSKTSFELGRLPEDLPDKLPNPDQTGETRALIQSKQTSKEGELELASVLNTNATSGSSTVNAIGTLDLSQSSTTPIVGTVATTSSTVGTDIVIPSYVSSTTTSQEILLIPDVVIPPSVASTSREVR